MIYDLAYLEGFWIKLGFISKTHQHSTTKTNPDAPKVWTTVFTYIGQVKRWRFIQHGKCVGKYLAICPS